MGRYVSAIDATLVDGDRESVARVAVERTSTLSLAVAMSAGLGASYLPYDYRATVSVFLPAMIFLTLWAVPRKHLGAEFTRQVYGWAAVCFTALSVAGIPVLIALGPVVAVSVMTVVIAAWMRSMSLVFLSIVCAAVGYVGLGGALAYAVEKPSINEWLLVGLLAVLGLAYVGYVRRSGPGDQRVDSALDL
jgi:hypothetical protein